GKIKGIGVWTVDMILLFTLKRPNIFPADDYHLKQLMTSLYQLDPKSRLKAQMRAVAEKWSPYQSLAVLYLLDWKVLTKTNKIV
ncbi:MAG: DNA-3-methyladenine glycosylase 2 family protein, partial [Bacteroidota bacterium]